MLHKNFLALGTAIGSCFAGLLQVVLPVLNSIVSAVTSAFNKIASVINSIFGIFGIKVGGGSAGGGGTVGGVIGDAVGGWELANDLKLVCTDNNAQVWSGVCDNCLGGGFKFRLTGGDFESNPWEMNWGGPMEHLVSNGDNISTNLTGSVKFSINFRGDVPALAQDATNPSPYFATVETAE